MNTLATSKGPRIRIAVIGSEPIRLAAFAALLGLEPDFEVDVTSMAEYENLPNADVILLSDPKGGNLVRDMAGLKAIRPDLRIIATGTGAEQEAVLDVLASGARGYMDETASAVEFVQAIRIVNQGSLWVSRRILKMFIEHTNRCEGRAFPAAPVVLTVREKEVLEMLVAGNSNNEIAIPLGIEVRTVKCHISKLLRKTGVRNRIALSSYAIGNAIVNSK